MIPTAVEKSAGWDQNDSKDSIPVRPAKVALLVWRAVCSLVNRVLKSHGADGGACQDRLNRLLDQQLMMGILTSTAQWERHANHVLAWIPRDCADPEEAETQETRTLGLGWWILDTPGYFRVGVADATAAMLYGMQFGGSVEYGGTITELSAFVKDYTSNCRINFPIPAYTADDRRNLLEERTNLQRAFACVSRVRDQFQLDAKVLVTELIKRRADARNFDSVVKAEMPESRIFDDQVDASKMLADALLASKRVQTYRQLGKMFTSMHVLAAELDRTELEAEKFAASATSSNKHAVVVKSPEPRRRGVTASRNGNQKNAGSDNLQESSRQNKAARALANLKFEDKEAHAKHFQDLQSARTRLMDSVVSLGDSSSRVDQLVKLMEQGHDKMRNLSTELTQTENLVQEVLDALKDALWDEEQAFVHNNLDKGKLPQEMMAQIEMHQQTGPSTLDRDRLRSQNARLRSQIEEAAKATEHEQRLQQHLDDLKVEVSDLQESFTSAKGHEESTTQEAADCVATRDAVLQSIVGFVNAGLKATKDCQAQVAKQQPLFESASKCDKAGQTFCRSMNKLIDGYAIKAFAAAWTIANNDFCMDIDSFLGTMDITGLSDDLLSDFRSMSAIGTRDASGADEARSQKKNKRKSKMQDDEREVQNLYQVLDKLEKQVNEHNAKVAEQTLKNARLRNSVPVEVLQSHDDKISAATAAISVPSSSGAQTQRSDSPRKGRVAQDSNAAVDSTRDVGMLAATAGPHPEVNLKDAAASQDASPSVPSAFANKAHRRQQEAQPDNRSQSGSSDQKNMPAGNAKDTHATLLMKLQDDIASARELRQDFSDKISKLQQQLQKQRIRQKTLQPKAEEVSEAVSSPFEDNGSSILQGPGTTARETESSSDYDQKIADQDQQPEQAMQKNTVGHASYSSAPDPTLNKEREETAKRPASQASMGKEVQDGEVQNHDVDDYDDDALSEPGTVDPWLTAFPEDDASLAKRKYVFCIAHALQFKDLHTLSCHKVLKMKLQRGQKQWRRELALKKKLVLKFLTGDARKLAEDALNPDTKGGLAAKYQAELQSLTERSAMLEKLLGFWRRRMASCDEELVGARSGFRKQVRTLLEGVQRLAFLLGSAARPRRRAFALATGTANLKRRTSVAIFRSAVASIALSRGKVASDEAADTQTPGETQSATTESQPQVVPVSDETQALEFVKTLLASLSDSCSSIHPRLRSIQTVLSDILLSEDDSGEELFRQQFERILALPAAQQRIVSQRLIELERARLLYVVRHSMIHQLKYAMAAGQRVISCLESPASDLRNQLKNGGPLFPRHSSIGSGLVLAAPEKKAASPDAKQDKVDRSEPGVADASARWESFAPPRKHWFRRAFTDDCLPSDTVQDPLFQHEQLDGAEIDGSGRVKPLMRLAGTAQKLRAQMLRRGKSSMGLVGDDSFQKALMKFKNLEEEAGLADHTYDECKRHSHIGHDDRRYRPDSMLTRSSSASISLGAPDLTQIVPGAAAGRSLWLRRATKAPAYNAEFISEWEAIREAVHQTRDERIEDQRRRVTEMMAEVGSAEDDQSDLGQNLRQFPQNDVSLKVEDATDVKVRIRQQINQMLRSARSQRHGDAGLPPARSDEALVAVRRKIGFRRARAQTEKLVMRERWLWDSDLFDDSFEPQTSLQLNSVSAKLPEDNEDERQEIEPKLSGNVVSRGRAVGTIGAGLTVMPPWMRRDYASDAVWGSLGDAEPFDLMCWLQPILMEARLAMAPKPDTNHPNWSRWSSSLKDSKLGIDGCSSAVPERLPSHGAGALAIGSKDEFVELQPKDACKQRKPQRRSLEYSPRGSDSALGSAQQLPVSSEPALTNQGAAQQLHASPDQRDGHQDQTVTARRERVRQGIFLSHEHRNMVVEVEDQLRESLRSHGELIETTLGLPLVIIVQTALAQDQGFAEVLTKLSRDEFVSGMASILHDLEEAYIGDGTKAFDYKVSSRNTLMLSGKSIESGCQKVNTGSSELPETHKHKHQSKQDPVESSKCFPLARHGIVGGLKLGRTALVSAAVPCKPVPAEEIAVLSCKGLDLGAARPAQLRYLCATSSNSTASLHHEAQKQWQYKAQTQQPLPSKVLEDKLTAWTKPLPSNVFEDKLNREESSARPTSSQLHVANAEPALSPRPDSCNSRSHICQANPKARIPSNSGKCGVEEVASERIIKSAGNVMHHRAAGEVEAETAFRQHFEQWQEWRCQKSVRSLHHDGTYSQTNVRLHAPTNLGRDFAGCVPRGGVDNISMQESEDIYSAIDLGRDVRNSAVEHCSKNSGAAAVDALCFPAVMKDPMYSKAPAADLEAEQDVEIKHAMREQVHDKHIVRDKSLSNYLTDFRDQDLELLLSDFSRPGTSAGSRPSTRCSLPGGLRPASQESSTPGWSNLGWSTKVARNSDSKEDRAASSSTTLPSIRGAQEYGEFSLPATAETGRCLSSTGESWRRALSSRAESPRWLHAGVLDNNAPKQRRILYPNSLQGLLDNNAPKQRRILYPNSHSSESGRDRGSPAIQDMTTIIMPPRTADGLPRRKGRRP
eukprot:TRINITY_DN4975_c0_g1_i3.p1 TRINITY_DN4975_c0_g1~~TRINITY_DN4975_c0_g1_i3.p1  ORF type:complete len:2544 (-),score=464.40 TRINITY_DN4975_c0_g1_i3:121-7752(-)